MPFQNNLDHKYIYMEDLLHYLSLLQLVDLVAVYRRCVHSSWAAQSIGIGVQFTLEERTQADEEGRALEWLCCTCNEEHQACREFIAARNGRCHPRCLCWRTRIGSGKESVIACHGLRFIAGPLCVGSEIEHGSQCDEVMMAGVFISRMVAI